MSFARPDLLGAAALLPLLLVAAMYLHARRRRRVAALLGDASLLQRLAGVDIARFPAARYLLLGMAGCAVGLAGAGPQWGRTAVRSEARAMNIVLALDVSKSMLAADVAPSRMERQTLLVRQLLRALPADRFGLVVFAGRAYIMSPVTSDHGAIELYLETLDPTIVSQGGSSLESAVLQASDLARGPNEVSGEHVVVLVSDGEALEDAEGIREAAGRAASAGVRFYTVGLATPAGAPIPELDAAGNARGLKRDETGQVVISRLGDDLLRGIAERTGGEYFDGSDAASVERLVARLSGLERAGSGAREQRTVPKERFAWFTSLALLLLALDAWLAQRRMSVRARRHGSVTAPVEDAPPNGEATATGSVGDARRPRRAPVRAVTTGLLLALLTQGFGIGDVERGNRHYRAGRYAEAAAAYQEALRDGSDSPQLRYNLGTALLQLGRLEEAEQQLRAALAAVDPELRERAHYNLGNRFLAEARRSPGAAQAEQLAAAIESYQQALRIAPGDTHAKWNLELALREQAEQQRRRQQQAEQEEQDQAEEQQQSSAGGSGSEQSSAADAGAERGDTREQQSLEQRQADQILNAAEQDERELARERLRKGQRRTPVLRDW